MSERRTSWSLRAGFIRSLGQPQRKHCCIQRPHPCIRVPATRRVALGGACSTGAAQERLSLAAGRRTPPSKLLQPSTPSSKHQSNRWFTRRSQPWRKRSSRSLWARPRPFRRRAPRGPPRWSAPTRTSRPTSAAAGSPSPAVSAPRTPLISFMRTTTREC